MDSTLQHLMNIINVDYIIRVTIAVVFGFCIGLERELTNKYAGLRTHILVCLGACVFTILSIYGFPTFAPGDNVDLAQATGIRDTSRVAAQIVTGIGFIGAGTVLRNGPIVLGLTTAATLWIAASIGMEKKCLPNSTKRTKRIKLSVVCDNEHIEKMQDFIIDKFQDISGLTKKQFNAEGNTSKISCIAEVLNKKSIKDLYKMFGNKEGVESVSVQETLE